MEGDKESKSADIPASSSSAMDLADYAPPTHSSQQTGRAIEERVPKRKFLSSLPPDNDEDEEEYCDSSKNTVAMQDHALTASAAAAAAADVASWAKSYCENVLGCSARGREEPDSEDEADSQFITVHNPAQIAGEKRKAAKMSHSFELVERPRKRVR